MADRPVYPLRTIDWANLQKRDAAERNRLLSACQIDGFFFLDLSSDATLLQDWNSLLAFMEEYFNRPLNEKMQDNRQSDTHGQVQLMPEAFHAVLILCNIGMSRLPLLLAWWLTCLITTNLSRFVS